jgi:hypothetical protein
MMHVPYQIPVRVDWGPSKVGQNGIHPIGTGAAHQAETAHGLHLWQALKVIDQAHHHEQMPEFEHMGCRRIHSQAARVTSGENVDAEVLTQVEVPQGSPNEHFRNYDFFDAVLLD